MQEELEGLDEDPKAKIPPWSLKIPMKELPPNNYRPITSLPMMWKILTAQIREDISYSLKTKDSSPKNRKDSVREQEEEEILYTLSNTSSKSVKRDKNISMA